jgi:hypothetical protein
MSTSREVMGCDQRMDTLLKSEWPEQEEPEGNVFLACDEDQL